MSQKTPKKNYVPAPEVPEELRPRLLAILEVMSGETSVSEAARRLNLARNYFQTILHKAEAAIIESISMKPAGRPAKSEKEAQTEEELRRLRKENEQLRDRVAMIDRLLGVAGDLVKGRELTNPRTSKKKSTKSTGSGDMEEPEKRAKLILAVVASMRRSGVPMHVISIVVGVSH